MSVSELNLTLDQRSAVPLYEQICQQIRRKIEGRQLRPGMPLPTNRELRAWLQVNYKTAQQAMSTLAKEGYVTRQARRGTIVRGVSRRGVVGIYTYMNLVNPDGKHEYNRLITGHLNHLLEREGRVHRMYLGSLVEGANMASEDLLRHIDGGGLCGVLLVNTPWLQIQNIVEHGRSLRVPVVSLTGSAEVDYSVRVDMRGYVRSAADFLRGRRCGRVGVIYNRNSAAFQEEGVIRRIMEEAGYETSLCWIIGDEETEDGGYEAMTRMPVEELDGLIIQDDLMAMGVQRRLGEMKVGVPDQLKVTTFWNQGSCKRLTLPFERFQIDISQQARMGLELLRDVIDGRRIDRPHVKLAPVYREDGWVETAETGQSDTGRPS